MEIKITLTKEELGYLYDLYDPSRESWECAEEINEEDAADMIRKILEMHFERF